MLRRTTVWLAVSSLSLGTFAIFNTGCQNLPGNNGEQGAVIGGLGGAAAGALIGGRHNRLLGALIGGAAGAGGGYLVGANWDKISGNKSDEARAAERRGRDQPARPEDVDRTDSADLNGDGFVTMDEVIAMRQAGLTDREMIRRLERTNQYFELTPQQENYLRDHGVDRDVIVAMQDMQPDQARLARQRISHD